MNETIECVLDARAAVGECPVWSVAEQALYWIDIGLPSLNRFDPATGDNRRWPLPEAIGCFALMAGGRALLALRSGLYTFDLATHALSFRQAPPYDPAQGRFNDGRSDRAGRFWLGTLRESPTAGDAALYRYDRRGLVEQAGGLGQANGLAFSRDDRLLYHADTAAGRIYQYDFDLGRGSIANHRLFVEVPGGGGKPDGAAIDETGCYWSACHGAGRLACYQPDGSLAHEIRLPVSQPTMMAFGGTDFRTLYITSERNGLDAAALAREPLAGGIFRVALDVAGLPEPGFDESAG